MKTFLKSTILILALLFVAAPFPALGKDGDAAALLKSGKAKMEKRDVKGALADFGKAVALKPDSAEAHLELGRALYFSRWEEKRTDQKDRVSKALAEINKAIDLDPKYSDAYTMRGMIESMDEKWREALVDLDKAIECNAKSLDAYQNRAFLKRQTGDYAGAMADYNKGLEINPKSPDAYQSRAFLKKLMGDTAGAVADYDKTLENMQDAEANRICWVTHERSEAKQAAGDLKGALADLDVCVKMQPDDEDIYLDRGCLKQDMGDLDGALKDYDKAITTRKVKYYPEAYAVRAFARVEKGEMTGAREDLGQFIKLDAKLFVADGIDAPMVKLATLNAERMDAGCTKFIEAIPDQSALLYLRAYARYAKGSYAESLADFKKALEMGLVKQSSKAAYYAYFFIWLDRSKLGESNEAMEELEGRFERPDGEYMNKWPKIIASFLIGRLDEGEFLALAAEDDVIMLTGSMERECQAYFYAGQKRLMDGDKKGAAELFTRSANAILPRNFEYLAAKMELKALKGK